MSAELIRLFDEMNSAQEQHLSLFLRSEREEFRIQFHQSNRKRPITL
jgi:hypothetical protein